MQRPHLHFQLGSVLPHQLSRSVKELFGSVAILGFAVSAVTIFEPIYLYSLGYKAHSIVGYYLLTYALYIVVLPLDARFAARFGFERSLTIGSLLLIPYYLVLFEIANNPTLFYVAPIIFTLQKMFYWPAYHADFATNATSGEVGREIGEASLVITLVSILGPIAGGAVITAFGFSTLFVAVMILIFLSNIPLLLSRQKVERRGFSYTAMWKNLFRSGRRSYILAYAGYAEEAVYMVLWPVFLFTVVAGALEVGVVMTAAGIITSLVLLYIGKLADLKNRATMVHAASLATAIVSFLRAAVFSTLTFIFGETLYRICRGTLDLPLISDLYDRAKKEGALEVVTGFEISLAIGKAAILALLFFVTRSADEPWFAVFLLGAAAMLLFQVLPRRTRDTSA